MWGQRIKNPLSIHRVRWIILVCGVRWKNLLVNTEFEPYPQALSPQNKSCVIRERNPWRWLCSSWRYWKPSACTSQCNVTACAIIQSRRNIIVGFFAIKLFLVDRQPLNLDMCIQLWCREQFSRQWWSGAWGDCSSFTFRKGCMCSQLPLQWTTWIDRRR